MKAGPNMVCKLNKSLYGLKQAPRCWNITFKTFLKKFGFRSSTADSSLYVAKIDNCKIFLSLFVDDGLLIAKDKNVINKILDDMRCTFKIVVTEPNKFVSMQLVRDRSKRQICIHQREYVEEIVNRFGMDECKGYSTPVEPGLMLRSNSSVNANSKKFPYRELIGSLMFVAIVSRPDISYSVNYLSRFLN